MGQKNQNNAQALSRELGKARKNRKIPAPGEEEKESVQEPGDFSEMGPRERLQALRSRTQVAVQERPDISGIDATRKENEALIETPLPTTLAIDMIPIDRIHNGVIYTDDGRCVLIAEVMPINFLLKSNAEQEVIVDEFEKFIRVMPDEIQIKSFSQKTDLSKYLAKIDEDIKTEKDERCRRMLLDGKQLLGSIGANESVTRRFFLVMSISRRGHMASDADIERELYDIRERAVSYLRQCGNIVLDMARGEETNGTAMILFDLLNRDCSSAMDFEGRVRDVYTYYESVYGRKSTDLIPVKEYFSPKKINMKNSDYIKIDNTYYTYAYVTSDGFPGEVAKGWVSAFINSGDGIDVDLFFKKENKVKSATRIGQRLRWKNSRISSMSDTTSEYSDLTDTISAGYYLKNGLSINSNDLYYACILVTISAQSLKLLKQKKNALETYLKTMEVFTGSLDYEMERAFRSSLPLGRLDKKICQRAKRNVLTCDLAAWYPFTSFEICDEDGILLGVNEMNNSLSVADFFNTDNYKNANIAIMGTTGAGKSYLLQLMAMRFRKKHIQTFVILPEKGHEFIRACRCMGGEFISLAPGSPQNINVMEIRKKDKSANRVLDGDSTESELAEKIQFMNTFVKLRLDDMSIVEEQLLDDALIVTYNKKGITYDNNSLWDPDHPERFREMPVIGDLYQELLKVDEASRLATAIKIFVDGSFASFNRQTTVNTDNMYTIINLEKMPDDMKAAGMLIAVDYVYGRAKENRTKRKAIIMDELWALIGSNSNRKAAEYTLEIFKVIRGYGGAAICATQDLNDFFALEDGRYGKGIINACKTKIVLNLEKNEADRVKELLDLSQGEYKRVLNFEKGHGLLSANGNNVPIHFMASSLENALITTDRRELERLVTDQKYAAFRELIAS